MLHQSPCCRPVTATASPQIGSHSQPRKRSRPSHRRSNFNQGSLILRRTPSRSWALQSPRRALPVLLLHRTAHSPRDDNINTSRRDPYVKPYGLVASTTPKRALTAETPSQVAAWIVAPTTPSEVAEMVILVVAEESAVCIRTARTAPAAPTNSRI